MQYLTRIILTTAMITAVLLQVSVAQDQWQRITDREAGFTISFPGKPSYEQSTDPTLPHQTETYKFFYNGRLLQIIFAPLVKQPRTPTELSDAFAEITRMQARDGKLLRQVKMSDGGRQYDNVTTDNNGIAYHRTRVYIHNGRYYTISYSMYATAGIDEREAARFFSSFKFTDNLPARPTAVRRSTPSRGVNNAQRSGWYKFRSPDGDFVVDFPGKPEFKEFPNPNTGSSDYKYYFHFGENSFIVSYREEPTAATQPERVMRQALEKALENNTVWRVLHHVRMMDGGHYIEIQGVVDGTPVYMRTKLYLRGTRLYHVSTMTQNLTGPNNADVVGFLSSFRLLQANNSTERA
jgi:hypothetical protein